MSFVFYAVLIIVSLSSVVFGLEWLSEAPPVWKPVVVATVKQPAAPKANEAAATTATKPADSAATAAQAPPSDAATADRAIGSLQTQTANLGADTGLAQAPAASDIIAPEPVTEATAPRCDVQACSVAYRSFRASDCTWQPYEGPRRFCDKGTPPPAPATAEAPPPSASETAVGQVSNKCDIVACRQAYFTFNPADCTYQPADGPRRLCTKGTPPRPDNAQAPEQGTDQTAAAASTTAEPDSAAKAPLCDVQACAAAYFTFNPADCTYQPVDGPRRLCTKGSPPRPQANASGEDSEAEGEEEEEEATVSVGTASVGAASDAGRTCNVQACAAAYVSFDPADCTYQPLNGPRRLCTR